MSKATLLIKFVFATLLLASLCMAQNPWFKNGVGFRPPTSTPSPWSLTDKHRSIFEGDGYTIQILTRSIKNFCKYLIVYGISLVTKLFPDRHQYLREVADAINGMVDCFAHYYNLAWDIFFVIYRFLARIPILGLLVYIPVTFIRFLLLIPQELIAFCCNFVTGILF